jgi:hypothetical protein
MLSVAHVLDTERETRRFRLLAVLVAGVTLAGQGALTAPTAGLVWILRFLVYAMALSLLLPRLLVSRAAYQADGAPALTALILLMALLDRVGVMGLVYSSGGIGATAVILMPLFIIYHTFYLGYRSGLFSVAVFTLLFGGATLWGGEVHGQLLSLVGLGLLFFFLPAVGMRSHGAPDER